MINDPSKAGHETDPGEMELLLTRLKESIGIFENGSKPNESENVAPVEITEESPTANIDDEPPFDIEPTAIVEEESPSDAFTETVAEEDVLEEVPAEEIFAEEVTEDAAEEIASDDTQTETVISEELPEVQTEENGLEVTEEITQEVPEEIIEELTAEAPEEAIEEREAPEEESEEETEASNSVLEISEEISAQEEETEELIDFRMDDQRDVTAVIEAVEEWTESQTADVPFETENGAETASPTPNADDTVVFVSADVKTGDADGTENTLSFAIDELIGLSRTDIPLVTPRLRMKRERKTYKAVIKRPETKAPEADEETAELPPVQTEQTDVAATADFKRSTGKRFSVKHARKTEPVRTYVGQETSDKRAPDMTEQTYSGAAASTVDYSAYRMSASMEEKEKGKTVDEYTSEYQTEQIRRQYKRALGRSTLRLTLSAILFAILLVVECLPLFGLGVKDMPLIASYPILLPLLSLQLLLLSVVLAYPEIKEGVHALLEKKPLPETYYIGAEVLILLYAVVACIEYGTLMTFYAMPPMLCALGAALSLSVILMDHIALVGEIRSFAVLSAPGDKLAAEMTRLSAHPEEMRAFPRLASPRSVRTLHIKKVQFVDGYYRQMNRRVEDFRQNRILFTVIFALSLLVIPVTAFLAPNATASSSLMAGAALAVLAAPVSFFLAHRYPVFRAASLAADEQRVFVGESAVQAYSLAKVIAFEDVEAFSSVNTSIRRIKLPSGVEVHQVLYYLTKAFGVIGGPLYGLFSTSTDRIDDYSDTQLLSAEQDGLLVQVGSKRVHIGKPGYLARNGITPYYDGEDEKYIAEGKISLMYVAVDGAFMAKFYISYEPSENFCANARKLAKRGMRVILRTFDPNLDDRILQNNPTLSVLPVKIVHKNEKQLNDYAQHRVYSGFVTSGSTRDILRLLLLCDCTKSVIGFGRLLRYIAAGVGAVLVTALALMGGLSYLLAPFSVLYYVLWFVPLAIEAKRKL